MIHVVTCGLSTNYDLGSPSILHGIYQLLREIYHDDFEMVNLQIGEVTSISVSDMPFQTISIKEFRAKKYLQALFLNRKFSGRDGQALEVAFSTIRKADILIDLYGICFCDKLTSSSCPTVLLPLYTMLTFPFSCVAKKYHVRSVKNTASYGPAVSTYSRRSARFAVRHLFDCMVAREEKSRQVMKELGVGECILLSPDTANLMPFSSEKHFDRPTVGISTSHQIVRQWRSAEEYVQCVAKLCIHIRKTYGADVLLIPNECEPESNYSDVDVSEDILEILHEIGGDGEVLDARNMNSTQIKNHIAACDVMVASRYHSCVAALSAGVPLIVIGWHYKYEELLHWYGQDEWLLSEADCDSHKLIQMFDRLWESKAERKAEIKEHFPEVYRAVIETGRKMLGVEDKK